MAGFGVVVDEITGKPVPVVSNVTNGAIASSIAVAEGKRWLASLASARNRTFSTPSGIWLLNVDGRVGAEVRMSSASWKMPLASNGRRPVSAS